MNKSEKNIDYKNTFNLGILFMSAGSIIMIATRNPAFLGTIAFGIILMINGLAKIDKWYDKN